MAAALPRICVGGFLHETNTFAPSPTTYADFLEHDAWPGLVRGDAMLQALQGLNLPAAGFIEAARAAGARVLPLLWCSAEPAGTVTADAFDRVTAELSEALALHLADGPIDGVYLDLHGAMVAENALDGETEVVRRVRTVIGPDVPVVCSLDWHANLSEELVDITEGLAIYRTYPHVDLDATGARAYDLLSASVAGTRVQKEWRPVPFLIPITAQCSLHEPCLSLFQRVRALSAQEDILSVDFAPGFPPADTPCCHPAVVVYALDATVAEVVVDELLEAVMAAEPHFDSGLVGERMAVQRAAAAQRRPVVLADVQDNPGAGGTSDTTGIIHALLEEAPGVEAVVGVLADPDAASAAAQAGVGATLTGVPLGAKIPTPTCFIGPGSQAPGPVEADLEVLAVGDGCFVCTGEMMRGTRTSLGPTALLRIAGTQVRVIVSSKRFQALDQAVFRHVGVEPGDEPIIVLKSSVHFRADFEHLAAEVILVESPGSNPVRAEAVSYRNLHAGLRLCPTGKAYTVPAHKRKADGELEEAMERPDFALMETIEFSDDDTEST
mmetsp:Transcript_104106/g.303948  ORF Transcript_104106/g.303948 Transcript_104106/m.303948 type:complete len:553 (-) Transcript_104106:79-1737(-)